MFDDKADLLQRQGSSQDEIFADSPSKKDPSKLFNAQISNASNSSNEDQKKIISHKSSFARNPYTSFMIPRNKALETNIKYTRDDKRSLRKMMSDSQRTDSFPFSDSTAPSAGPPPLQFKSIKNLFKRQNSENSENTFESDKSKPINARGSIVQMLTRLQAPIEEIENEQEEESDDDGEGVKEIGDINDLYKDF
jgi:hypothetical protein